MIFLGITVIFLAELVLFINIVMLIVKIDKSVNSLNKFLSDISIDIRLIFKDTKALLQDFTRAVEIIFKRIEDKKIEYAKDILKNLTFYSALILLKGKYKKTFIIYNLLKDVYSGYKSGIKFA